MRVEKVARVQSAAGAAAPAGRSQRLAFERMLLVITLLLIFFMAARTPLDSDMWWHLSAGEEMLRRVRSS
jgi:hypothetical protein